jgi:RNA polymerase sigma-70 factor, ECF subfamily
MLIANLLPLPDDSARALAQELDPESVGLCQRGDREALRRFVRCYERRVFAYLSRVLGRSYPIEDLAQEAFVRAYIALARFETNGGARLSTWLLTIVHRVAVDARRRRRAVYDLGETEQLQSPLSSPEERLHQEQTMALIARAVEELPPDQREVFVLAEFHELSMSEIARVVGAREATVKTRLFRAKARLQLALGPLHMVLS